MSVNPERSGVIISWVSVFEVGCRVGGGRRSSWGRVIHSKDIKQWSGAEIAHGIYHALVSNTKVLILTQHVTALVLVFQNIFVLEGCQWSVRFIIDNLFVMVMIVIILVVL